MRQDVIHAAAGGAHGVVLGLLDAAGEVDVARLVPLVALAEALALDLTFHRAFDVAASQQRALEDLVGCRVRRVLTSGARRVACCLCRLCCSTCRRAGGRACYPPLWRFPP